MSNTPSKAEIEALVKRHGATSYRNRSDTRHPAYGFTEVGLQGLIAEVRKRTYTTENKQKWAIKTRYGLTPSDVQAMLEKQGGACAICVLPLTKHHIDHCHTTGKVRGLLCHRCNTRLGGLDDKQWRDAAFRYLGLQA